MALVYLHYAIVLLDDLASWLGTLVASDAGHIAEASAATGAIVFALIRFADANFHPNAELKFWGSIALAMVLPVLAYIALELYTHAPVDLNGLFLAIFVGWTISQGIHRVTS